MSKASATKIDNTLPADSRVFTVSSVQLKAAPKVNPRASDYVPTTPLRPLKVAPILIVIVGGGPAGGSAETVNRDELFAHENQLQLETGRCFG